MLIKNPEYRLSNKIYSKFKIYLRSILPLKFIPVFVFRYISKMIHPEINDIRDIAKNSIYKICISESKIEENYFSNYMTIGELKEILNSRIISSIKKNNYTSVQVSRIVEPYSYLDLLTRKVLI